MFDQRNALRRMVVVGRTRRDGVRRPARHPSFDEQGVIIDALERCDPEGAEQAMRSQLRVVRARIEP